MEVMMGQREGSVYQMSMVDSFMESIAVESILMATKSVHFILSLCSFLNEAGILEMFNHNASRLYEPILIGSEGKILRLAGSGTVQDANEKDISEVPVDDGETDDDDDDDDGDDQDDDAEDDDDDDDEEDGADDNSKPGEDGDDVEANGQEGDEEDEEDDDGDDDDEDDDDDDEDDEDDDEEDAPEPPAKKRK